MIDAVSLRPVPFVAGHATPPGLAANAVETRGRTPALVPLPPTYDDHTLAGPPPAFEASLLEVTTDLRTAIARMNAARGGWAAPGTGSTAALPGLYRR